jgi:hypothetical protein
LGHLSFLMLEIFIFACAPRLEKFKPNTGTHRQECSQKYRDDLKPLLGVERDLSNDRPDCPSYRDERPCDDCCQTEPTSDCRSGERFDAGDELSLVAPRSDFTPAPDTRPLSAVTPRSPPRPVSTKSTARLPHCEHTSRPYHSGIGVSAPCRRASSAGFGSARCRQSRHHTIIRAWAAAVPPRVAVVRSRVSLHGSANKLPTIATTSCPIAPRAAIPAAHAAHFAAFAAA